MCRVSYILLQIIYLFQIKVCPKRMLSLKVLLSNHGFWATYAIPGCLKNSDNRSSHNIAKSLACPGPGQA